MNNYEETPVKPSFLPVVMIGLAIFGLPAAASAWQEDYVVAGILGLVGFGCLVGYRVGFVNTVASMAALFVAIHFAPQVGAYLEPKIAEWFSASDSMTQILSLATAGLGIVIAITGFVSLAFGFVFKNSPQIQSCNRWAGFLLGGSEATLGALLLLGGVLVIEPTLNVNASQASKGDFRSQVVESVGTMAEQTRASAAGPTIEKYNPFVRYPNLNVFGKINPTFAAN